MERGRNRWCGKQYDTDPLFPFQQREAALFAIRLAGVSPSAGSESCGSSTGASQTCHCPLLEGPTAPLAVQVLGTKLGHASIRPACRINLHLQSVETGVYRLSSQVHIHECAFHVSITLQSPYFFPSRFLLSYGNPSFPQNIFSPMRGSWGWRMVFSEV